MSEAHGLYRKWGQCQGAGPPNAIPGTPGRVGRIRRKGQISTDLLKNVLEHYDGPSGGIVITAPTPFKKPQRALPAKLNRVRPSDLPWHGHGHGLCQPGLSAAGERWRAAIHFAGDAGQGVRELTEPLLLEETDQSPRSTVRLVFRTLRPVIVDGDHLGGFAKDKYMRKAKPKSVAGIPLMSQGVPVGVLYLENTLISAFSRLIDSNWWACWPTDWSTQGPSKSS